MRIINPDIVSFFPGCGNFIGNVRFLSNRNAVSVFSSFIFSVIFSVKWFVFRKIIWPRIYNPLPSYRIDFNPYFRISVKRSFIILSLLAAAGMVHAATPIYSWEWTAEGAQITAPNWNGSFNYTSGNDYATFGSSSGTPYNSNITGIQGSFTVSFDLKNLSSTSNGWKDIFSLYTNGTVSGESNSMVLEFTNNGELYLYNKGFGGQTGGNINTGLTWTCLLYTSPSPRD